MTDPIVQALVARRVQAGLSQREIGDRMGRSMSEVSRIEHGRDIRLSTLRRYSAALDCELMVVAGDLRPHQRRARVDNGRRQTSARDLARTQEAS